MKAAKFIHVFNPDHVKPQKFVIDEVTLNGYLPAMFTDTFDWDLLATLDPKRKNDPALVEANLPYHTRDNVWLTKYLVALIHQDEPDHKMSLWDLRKCQNFVKKSDFFNFNRTLYELHLTEAQINFMMNGKYNKIIPPQYAYHKIRDHSSFYKLFREGVVQAMDNLGVDRHSTESGLEIGADLWRRKTMLQSFHNVFYPDLDKLTKEQSAHFNHPARMMHEYVWMANREHQYYQEHKDIIDEYALSSFNMKLPQDYINKLWEVEYKYALHYPETVKPAQRMGYRPFKTPTTPEREM